MISLYFLKTISVISCLFFCTFLIGLVLLQRAEEGAFRKAISIGRNLDAKDLTHKTIWGSAVFAILVMCTQYIFFYIYSRGI